MSGTFLYVLLTIIYFQPVYSRIAQNIDLSKFDKAKLDQKSFEAVQNLHVNWYQFSIKALMGRLGKELYEQMPQDQKVRLAKCLNVIDDKRDLVISARCLVNARKKYKRSLQYPQSTQQDVSKSISQKRESISKFHGPIPLKEAWTGTFKIHNDMTPLARPKSYSTKSKMVIKSNSNVKWATNYDGSVLMKKKEKYANFEPRPKYPNFRPRIFITKAHDLNNTRAKRSPYRLGNMDFEDFVGTKDIEEQDMPRKVKQMNKLSSISNPVQSPIAKVTNLIRNLYHKFTPTDSNKDNKDKKPIKWTRTYEKLLHLKEELERKERLPGAKTYNLRMYDLVLGHDKPTLSPKESRTPKGLLQMAMNMVESVRSNKAVQETGNVKFLSPRFAPLMPDKTEAKSSHMSPTILAFYEEKYDNKSFASIPTVLKATGMSKTDRDNVLELLMDVSGTTKHVGDALNLLDKLNFFGMEGEIFSVTEKISTAYDLLEKSFNVLQHSQIKEKGYTFLEKHQMMRLYRDQGVKIPEAERHLRIYENIRPDEREEALWARIERIAMNRPDNATLPKSRRKRQISLLSPVVLAPYMFTPVFGLTVLGPVILSPSLFSPLIANPAVLSPFILSPGVPMPEILSPYVLCPYILSPLALAPFVLTPYVLSPNIVNPYALSPVILSPFVLSPDILSPSVLGGPILSPNVGSPSVLTEGFLTANVLSPSFLS